MMAERDMRIATIRLGCAIVAAAGILAAPMTNAADTRSAEEPGKPVRYTRIGSEEYQNFINNWDDKAKPVLYAVIRTPAEYNAIYHPAPVMGGKRPFAPKPEFFAREQILLVARVTPAPKDLDKAFEVERVVENGQDLELRYRYHQPGPESFTLKSQLAIRIP
jgi:hypothetical protein